MRKWLFGVVLCLVLLVGAIPQPRTVAAPVAIEPYLTSGRLTEGIAAMQARLQQNPNDDQARFSLGVTQLMTGVERLMQSLYRYGVRSNSLTGFIPILRLPVPDNPKPETLRYEDTRQVLQAFLNDLAQVRTTLEPIKDPAVKLPLPIGLVRLDFNGDGKAEPTESLWKIFETVAQVRVREADVRQFSIAFDAGDVLWLRGYTHLFGAIVEFGLAHDGQEMFNRLAHVMFKQPATPYRFLVDGYPDSDYGGINFTDIVAFVHLLRFPVVEPARMTTALQHLQTVTALSRQSWQQILAETDRDREWLPNPRQTGVIPNVRVTQEMIDRWFAFLDEADSILQGKTLLPFWRRRELRGINLNKAFTEPDTIDVVLWVQGTGAAKYLEVGKVTDAQFWEGLQQVFRNQFFSFAAWFN